MADRRTTVVAVVVLGALVVAFLAGRQTAPVRVEERVRVETVEVEKQVLVVEEKVRVEKVEVVRTVEVARRTEKQVSHPDGRVEITRTEETKAESDARTETVTDLELQAALERETTLRSQLERESVTVRDAARWKLGITAGTDLSKLRASPPLILGGRGAVRIGPVWLGGWAMTNRTAGLSGELQF